MQDDIFSIHVEAIKEQLQSALICSKYYKNRPAVLYALAEVTKDYLFETSDDLDTLKKFAAFTDDAYCEVLSDVDRTIEASMSEQRYM